VRGYLREDLPVQKLGGLQISRVVVLDRGLQRLVDGHRGHFKHGERIASKRALRYDFPLTTFDGRSAKAPRKVLRKVGAGNAFERDS
jgi:hypothetical protein